jgi:hypothetical protein
MEGVVIYKLAATLLKLKINHKKKFMSDSKHQHFIPRSYLRNFAIEEHKKFFVEGKKRQEIEPRKKLLSIRDICVEKNIYSIPNIEGEDQYKIEKFYAEQIDSVYPAVYELLINPSITNISKDQREQIIMTSMSLFFRTPKFLNINEQKTDAILNYAVKKHINSAGIVKFKLREYDLDFHISKLEDVRLQLKIRNKLNFLQDHLEDWHNFVQFKVNSGLSVYHIYEEYDLITSDNPVIMHSVVGNAFSLFDPTNIISLPLDNKHFLTIFPNTEDSLTDRIFHGERDKWFCFTTNYDIEQNSEDWILGKPGSVRAHIQDQKQFGELNYENEKALEEIREKASDLNELATIVELYGFASQKVADKIKELRKKNIHKKDPEISKYILELEKYGFIIDE